MSTGKLYRYRGNRFPPLQQILVNFTVTEDVGFHWSIYRYRGCRFPPLQQTLVTFIVTEFVGFHHFSSHWSTLPLQRTSVSTGQLSRHRGRRFPLVNFTITEDIGFHHFSGHWSTLPLQRTSVSITSADTGQLYRYRGRQFPLVNFTVTEDVGFHYFSRHWSTLSTGPEKCKRICRLYSKLSSARGMVDVVKVIPTHFQSVSMPGQKDRDIKEQTTRLANLRKMSHFDFVFVLFSCASVYCIAPVTCRQETERTDHRRKVRQNGAHLFGTSFSLARVRSA